MALAMFTLEQVQDIVKAGFTGLHDSEVDAFAEGLGLPSSVEDESRENVVELVMEHIAGMAKDTEKAKQAKQAKASKPAKASAVPKSNKDESKAEKPKRKQSTYNVFVKRTLDEWKAEHPDEKNPEGGAMKYASGLWAESFMNPKSKNYDEERTKEEMEEANGGEAEQAKSDKKQRKIPQFMEADKSEEVDPEDTSVDSPIPITEEQLGKLKIAGLKMHAKRCGSKTSGKKEDLVNGILESKKHQFAYEKMDEREGWVCTEELWDEFMERLDEDKAEEDGDDEANELFEEIDNALDDEETDREEDEE